MTDVDDAPQSPAVVPPLQYPLPAVRFTPAVRGRNAPALAPQDHEMWRCSADSPAVKSLAFVDWQPQSDESHVAIPAYVISGTIISAMQDSDSVEAMSILQGLSILTNEVNIDLMSQVVRAMANAQIFTKVYTSRGAFTGAVFDAASAGPTI